MIHARRDSAISPHPRVLIGSPRAHDVRAAWRAVVPSGAGLLRVGVVAQVGELLLAVLEALLDFRAPDDLGLESDRL
jgi:hypothetical protein